MSFSLTLDPANPYSAFEALTSRVVGRGLVSQNDIDSSGFLVNADDYIANGIVGPTAVLTATATGERDLLTGARLRGSIRFVINGHSIGTMDLATESPGEPADVKSLSFPIAWLKFAARKEPFALRVGVVNGVNPVPSDPAGLEALRPDPVGNVMEGLLSGANGQLDISASIEFKALDPIIFVHGWHGSKANFGPSPSSQSASACGLDPHPGQINGGFNFIQPFANARAPYDCRVSIERTADNHDGALTLRSEIDAIVASYGAKHVHIIAHSKGGWWTRTALPGLLEAHTVGVNSVITLSTPHGGSPLADLLVGAHEHPWRTLSFLNVARLAAFFRNLSGGYDDGAIDLRTNDAEENNLDLVPPRQFFVADGTDAMDAPLFVSNPAKYLTLGSDAGDGNGTVNPNDISPYTGFPSHKAAYLYRFLGKTLRVRFQRINGNPVSPQFDSISQFINNDLAVQAFRAIGNGFVPVLFAPNSTLPGSLIYTTGNHQSYLRPTTASRVFGLVKAAQAVTQ